MSITIISLSNPVKELPKKTINWKELPENLKEKILECEYFMVRNSQSLLIYNDRKCVIDCMINLNYETKEIEILNAYAKEGKLF